MPPVRNLEGVASKEKQPQITDAMIARRAFEISLTDGKASPQENWERAERELRAEAEAHR